MSAELETVITTELSVSAPPDRRVAGRIRLQSGIEVEAIGLSSHHDARERTAADELAAYLEQVTGKRLEVNLIEGAQAPAATLLVGAAATECGLVSTEELKPLALDGYVAVSYTHLTLQTI